MSVMNTKFRALIVEDDPVMLHSLQSALVRLGYNEQVVSSAEEAIERLQRDRFDAVFTELCIREQGGRGIARWLRGNGVGTKLFVMTGWRGQLEPTLLRFEGIHGVIRKPLIFNELRDTVLEHFG